MASVQVSSGGSEQELISVKNPAEMLQFCDKCLCAAAPPATVDARGAPCSAVPVKAEIERKFLVAGDSWKAGLEGRRLKQGYLVNDDTRQVRVRTAGDQAWLTIKGRAVGMTRLEFEYPIPLAHAERLLEELCRQPIIDKTRYEVLHGRHTWEIDEFHGANAGLVVAEIELGAEDERFALPEWVGQEVTEDPRYANASLVSRPYRDWADGS